MNSKLALVLSVNNGWQLLDEYLQGRLVGHQSVLGETYSDREKWLGRVVVANAAIQELKTIIRDIEILKEEINRASVEA